MIQLEGCRLVDYNELSNSYCEMLCQTFFKSKQQPDYTLTFNWFSKSKLSNYDSM